MLIVGCGGVGTKVAAAAQARGEAVRCIVHSDDSVARLARDGLPATQADLDSAAFALPDGDLTRIFYFAPPPRSGRTDPRIARFLAALPAAGSPRIVYISTTGVYGDCGGQQVDETWPANPQVDRAFRRHDAERRLLDWRAAGRGSVVILRVAGIYGPHRLPLERLKRGEPMVGAADAPWTNRIHIDDVASVCDAAMARGRDGGVYNVSDGNPGNMRDYFDRVADAFGLPRAPLVRLADADHALSAGMLSYLGESRRLENRLMREELGIKLRFPTLDDGLADCVAHSRDA